MSEGNSVKGCHNKAVTVGRPALSAFVRSTDYYATVDGMEMRRESVQSLTRSDIAFQVHREETLN